MGSFRNRRQEHQLCPRYQPGSQQAQVVPLVVPPHVEASLAHVVAVAAPQHPVRTDVKLCEERRPQTCPSATVGRTVLKLKWTLVPSSITSQRLVHTLATVYDRAPCNFLKSLTREHTGVVCRVDVEHSAILYISKFIHASLFLS